MKPEKPRAKPVREQSCKVRDFFTGHQIRMGVMGSAGGGMQAAVIELCHQLGKAIAESGCVLLTGACPGLPHDAVLGARKAGGHVIGISPASSLREHIETYGSPYEGYDVLIFTGLGFMGRELINIRSSDIVIVVGGRSGTLGEFAIAYESGKLIGVLEGTGGITRAIETIQTSLNKKTGAEIIYDAEPKQLVARLLKKYRAHTYVCPGHPASRRGSSSETRLGIPSHG